jgi:hypothetical protein
VGTVRDLKIVALKCHGWRHGNWEATTDAAIQGYFNRAPFGYREVQLCGRGCGMIRHALFARGTGEQLTNWSYVQPDGYKVDEPSTLQDYRREIFRRRSSR